MKNVVYFDVEYANTKNKSICQIGLMSEDYHTKEPIYPEIKIYINPDDRFDDFCVRVHGISNEKVKNEPTFDKVWDNEIKKYFINSVITGHNVASSDINALIKNLTRYNLDIPEIYYIDTLEIAKDFIPSYICDYSLLSLCSYFDIDIDSNHDAFDDACACSDLLNSLENSYQFDIETYVRHYKLERVNEFVEYISNPEIKREIAKLLGTIKVISHDKIIDTDEFNFLNDWYLSHQNMITHNEVGSILITLKNILDDGYITMDELQTLENIAMTYISNIKASEITIATQTLQGIIESIIHDNAISEDEFFSLSKWIYENNYLLGHFPYDKIHNTLETILIDGAITHEEKSTLLSILIDVLNPINDVEHLCIDFSNKHFCLSGNFLTGQKSLVEENIRKLGGIIDTSIKKKETNYLVIGDADCFSYSNGTYGSKVKKAIEFNNKGSNIIIIKESQLFN